MSVINQVLLDLEKRRASGAERKTLPNHVRVMPPARGGARAAWSAALLVALLGSAAAWTGMRVTGAPQTVVPADSAAAPTTAAAIPGAAAVAQTGHASELQVAARLSFELSRIPDPLPEAEPPPAAGRAIPSARVIAKAAPPHAAAVPARVQATAPSRAVALPVAASAGEVEAAGATRAPSTAPEVPRAQIDKRIREPTARELAEADYRKATALLHQRRLGEAREGFESALARHPAHHGARQALLGLLVEAGHTAEAERLMRDALQIAPHQIGFAMALARLQVDRGDAPAAIATLQDSLPHAQKSGNYLAFLGGLLQREQRDGEAVEQFHAALRLRPDRGVWLLGLGISLQALGRDAEAREAFQRARTSPGLSGDLQAFADQRLRQLP